MLMPSSDSMSIREIYFVNLTVIRDPIMKFLHQFTLHYFFTYSDLMQIFNQSEPFE